MNKLRNRVNLDHTLSFTQSSFTYKDPYRPRGNPLYKARNAVWTFFALRNIENEFVDFKSYNLDRQFKEVYADVSTSFKRNDKVNLQRSLSESMFTHATSLTKAKAPNPFLRHVERLKLLQARVYAETDHLLPEEQWAQITVRLQGYDSQENYVTQYNVFERRLADKLTYLDWKVSFSADEEDFIFLHSKNKKDE